jgi:hypothetical protein
MRQTPWRSKISIFLEKCARLRVRRSIFADHHDLHQAFLDVIQQTFQRRALRVPAGEAGIVIIVGYRNPAFRALARHEGMAIALLASKKLKGSFSTDSRPTGRQLHGQLWARSGRSTSSNGGW